MKMDIFNVIFGIANVFVIVFSIFVFVRLVEFLSNYKKDKKDIESKLNELSEKLDKMSK